MKTKFLPFILGTLLFIPTVLFGNSSEKEKLVDQLLQANAEAITPEAIEEAAKTAPNMFQGKFGDDQKKFDDIFAKHAKELARAVHTRQLSVMKKVMKPFYLEHYSEEDLKGILEMLKLPVNEKMKKALPEMMKATTETAQKFVMFFGNGSGLAKVMSRSLKEAREKGINKEALDKAEAIFKENTKNVDLTMLEKAMDVSTVAIDTTIDPSKKEIIAQLVKKQLNEQLQPFYTSMQATIPNKFDAQFGAEQDKFNEIFEKNRKSFLDEFKLSFTSKMESIMSPQYNKTFSKEELLELVKLGESALSKKQLEVNAKASSLAPAFQQAQQDLQDDSELNIYLKIFEEAEKAGVKSPEFLQMLEGIRLKVKH